MASSTRCAVLVSVLVVLFSPRAAVRHLSDESQEISIGVSHMHKEEAFEDAWASMDIEELKAVAVEEEARAKRAIARARAARAEVVRRQGREELQSEAALSETAHRRLLSSRMESDDEADIDAESQEDPAQLQGIFFGGRRRRRWGKIVKVITKPIVDVGKNTIHVAKVGVDATGHAIKTASKAIANFLGGAAGDLCTHVVTLACDTVVVDKATGVEGMCADMCGMTDAEVEAVGGGPEDPVADTVVAALTPGCAVGCAIAFDSLTVDAWGTDKFSEAVCGYCGL